MVEIKHQENDTVKLPNNIRQVGMPGDTLKIYIEDYVMTYLNQVAGKRPFAQRAALLLGDVVKKDQTEIFFISAAIHMDHLQIQEDSLQMTTEIWSELYGKIEQYFKDKHIIGWFLSRPGQTVAVSSRIEKVQSEQFRDKGQLVYLMDPMDREDAFFVYKKGQLIRQQGYYIYYERNEAMQNFMVEKRREEDGEPEAETTGFQNRLFERKTDQHVKKEIYKRSVRRPVKWLPQAAAVVLVVLIAAAVRKNIYGSGQQASQVVNPVVVTESAVAESVQSSNVDIVENIMQQAAESVTETEAVAESTVETEDMSDEAAAAGTHQSYTVQEGDTLLKISRNFYQDAAHVEAIIQLNNIENPDYIYPGMVLQLP